MRSILGTPVPKVFSWNSKADNPVGAEYIIMEKLPGVQLDQVWGKLGIEARFKVVKRIAKYQADWANMSFSQFASLYYKQDLPSADSLVYTNKDGEQITNGRFATGPSTGRENTDDSRKEMEFDRGPCMCVNIKGSRRRGGANTGISREIRRRIRDCHWNERNHMY